ncbi:hypothetical protein CDAR_379141 [Caerostris darwini]|uniref:Uncharacterized protein n=1 Tax=Caerostris darwini TaxID=1538125 RepID=A0AAV4S6R0_9ARAC|nr:hypothetical protein CDAR_379141 [Caerostris darwini]
MNTSKAGSPDGMMDWIGRPIDHGSEGKKIRLLVGNLVMQEAPYRRRFLTQFEFSIPSTKAVNTQKWRHFNSPKTYVVTPNPISGDLSIRRNTNKPIQVQLSMNTSKAGSPDGMMDWIGRPIDHGSEGKKIRLLVGNLVMQEASKKIPRDYALGTRVITRHIDQGFRFWVLLRFISAPASMSSSKTPSGKFGALFVYSRRLTKLR